MTAIVAYRVGSRRRARSVLLAAGALAALLAARPAAAQEGEAWAVAVGGGLGLASGTLLADVGAILPCGQTRAGAHCVQLVVGFGGGMGLVSGAAAGYADAESIEDAALGAAIGSGIGFAAGLAIRPFAEGFGWEDVAAIGLVGGAIGASLPGSAIGFGAGAVTGVVLWKVTSTIGQGNAVAATLAGLAVGGLTTWLVRAARDPTDRGLDAGIPVGVRISF